MFLKNKDRYSLAEAYNTVRECECQHANMQADLANSSEERLDMILNNLVNINNKAASLVKNIQAATESGEPVDEWVSEKIAVAASMLGAITDYYAKYNTDALSTNGLQLQPSTVAMAMPAANNMPAMSISI